MSITVEQKHYLTKAGLNRVQREYGVLLEFRNAKTRNETPSVLYSEDVNPEYLTLQEDLNVLEARIEEYESILRNVEVIKLPPRQKRAEVCMGAAVTVDIEGSVDTFVIVGVLEADPDLNKISNESPLGRALLGKKEREEISIRAAEKERLCKILKIQYS